MLELLLCQPVHVGCPPGLLARIMTSQPKHQRQDLLTLACEMLLRRLTGAREISHGLMPFVGYPDGSELAGTRQLGQFHRIATVRLHPNAGFLRDERRSCQDRKSTRLNSSHMSISYAVFCLKKK